MNELQRTKDYIIGKFQADPLVNTITTLTDDLVDTNKEIIYPLVNIDYKSGIVRTDSILYSLHIKTLDQNDIYIKTTDSKLLQDTNADDIMNETANICQSFINSFRQYNSEGIEMNSISDVVAIKNVELNGLSGHEFNIVLSIPNDGSSCPE